MEAARFNIYWFLSLIVPAIIMILATYKKTRLFLIVGALLSFSLTYAMCNLAVQEKWRIRNDVAITEQQKEDATADGANIVFTAFFIGPFEAIVYTFLWGYVGRKMWSRLLVHAGNKET